MRSLAELLLIAWWVHGVAVAQGFWMTAGCVVLPPMAFVVSMMEVIKWAS